MEAAEAVEAWVEEWAEVWELAEGEPVYVPAAATKWNTYLEIHASTKAVPTAMSPL